MKSSLHSLIFLPAVVKMTLPSPYLIIAMLSPVSDVSFDSATRQDAREFSRQNGRFSENLGFIQENQPLTLE